MMKRKEVPWGCWLLASAWMLPAAGLGIACRLWPEPCPAWLWNLCLLAAAAGLHQWGTDAARLAWQREADAKKARILDIAGRMDRIPEELEPRLPRRRA